MYSTYQWFEFTKPSPLCVDNQEQGFQCRGIPTSSGKFRRGKRKHISYSDHAQNVTLYPCGPHCMTFTVGLNFFTNSFSDARIICINLVLIHEGNAISSPSEAVLLSLYNFLWREHEQPYQATLRVMYELFKKTISHNYGRRVKIYI
jgi:hypothetical protein